MKNKLRIIYIIILGLFVILSSFVYALTKWFKHTFGVTFDLIYYHLHVPLNGTNTNFVTDATIAVLPFVLFVAILFVVYVIIDNKVFSRIVAIYRIRIKNITAKFDLILLTRIVCMLLAISVAFGTFKYMDTSLKIMDFMKAAKEQSHIYENYYVDPDEVTITEPKKKKNLIYIYLESMETTYTSHSEGGEQEHNYIPNLTKLASDYDSFSDKDNPYPGGFLQTFGTGWTAGGLFSTASGIPLAFSMDIEDDLDYSRYAPGVTTIGDLLKDRGYNQEFICGSDAEFASRSNFYQQHGDFYILDYPEAIERGFIPADYKVWWGYEDRVLYDIAKQEVTRLASLDEPFNLTFLTVDTHMVDGYFCPLCRNEFPQKAANIISCADRQLYDFVKWCSEQDFYEDTVIVITGDHPRHDSSLVEGIPLNNRPVYNCIINSSVDTTKKFNRTFTHMDIFPTTMAALGFEIEGERLGLGTNLYSDKQTLAEELGFDNLNTELSKYSTYYIDRFTKEKAPN